MNDWGPLLVLLGSIGLFLAWVVHGACGRPTIFSRRPDENAALSRWERLSVPLLVYGLWSAGFGAVLWRGMPPNPWDTRFAFEKSWPVIEWAEWFYASVYLVPLAVPWLAPSRPGLRRFAFGLWTLLAASLALFAVFPFVAPPRGFTPASLPGRLLAWETSRPDFAAAALPSFHVFWALLCARVLAERGRGWRRLAWGWALAVAGACIATGAHAILDVIASLILFPLLTGTVVRRLTAARLSYAK